MRLPEEGGVAGTDQDAQGGVDWCRIAGSRDVGECAWLCVASSGCRLRRSLQAGIRRRLTHIHSVNTLRGTRSAVAHTALLMSSKVAVLIRKKKNRRDKCCDMAGAADLVRGAISELEGAGGGAAFEITVQVLSLESGAATKGAPARTGAAKASSKSPKRPPASDEMTLLHATENEGTGEGGAFGGASTTEVRASVVCRRRLG